MSRQSTQSRQNVGTEKLQQAGQALQESQRQAAGGAPVIEAKAPRKMSFRVASLRDKPKWYLEREGELAMVTDEDYNEALGITKITIQHPTDRQYDSGIVCRVRMESLTGTDEGITIWESKTPGEIYLMAGGARESNKPTEDGRKRYYRDRVFSNAATAQILSYVTKHLIPADA